MKYGKHLYKFSSRIYGCWKGKISKQILFTLTSIYTVVSLLPHANLMKSFLLSPFFADFIFGVFYATIDNCVLEFFFFHSYLCIMMIVEWGDSMMMFGEMIL